MALRRSALICLLVAHVLLVWGGIGFLGEIWIRIPFCTGSEIGAVSWFLAGLWFVSTLSPVLGFLALWRDQFLNAYVFSVALTLGTVWLAQFLVEVRVMYCDSL